ncbi:MAG: sugar ABC transporter ATP-binding protein [Anaeromyxobacter sp.]
MDQGSARLTVRSVSKRFGPVHAVRDVSFAVRAGAVHALVGENGAGKSTLVKIITGMQRPDAGAILLDGEPCAFATPIEARRRGITAVYQDPRLFPHLDVAENIFMGIQPRTRLGLVDQRRMYGEAGRMLRELGVDIDPRSLLAGRSVAEVQFVEIVRAMIADLKVLILDEPTASLTPAEAERLFAVADGLRRRGVSILFISHRLEEIRRIADDVTVMRDGEHVITTAARDLSEEDMVRHMVGRELKSLFVRQPAQVSGPPAFEVRGLSLEGTFAGVSFGIRPGEIVALAGLVGAGRTEIAESIFGLRPPDAGTVVIGGQAVRPARPAQMVAHGVAYIPEDRDAHGLVVEQGVASNVCMPVLDRLAALGGLLTHRAELAFTAPLARDFEVKAATLDAPVGSLSGGNRQKVVLAKWLATRPKVLILDEPTHGIDVGTKSQVHQRIAALAAEGYPVLLISSDLPEVLAMADRILVVAGGRIVAELARGEATQERIMTAAALGPAAAQRAAEEVAGGR